MNHAQWLGCTVSLGQFSNEFGVAGHDFQGREFSLFVPRSYVHCDRDPNGSEELPAKLKTVVLERKNGLCLVRLPAPTFDNGSTLTVREDQIEEVALPQFA